MPEITLPLKNREAQKTEPAKTNPSPDPLKKHDDLYVPYSETEIRAMLDTLPWDSYSAEVVLPPALLEQETALAARLTKLIHEQTLKKFGITREDLAEAAYQISHELVYLIARLWRIYRFPQKLPLKVDIQEMPDGAYAKYDPRGIVIFSWGQLYILMNLAASIHFGQHQDLQAKKNLYGKYARLLSYLKKFTGHELCHTYQQLYQKDMFEEALVAARHRLIGNKQRYHGSDAELMPTIASNRVTFYERARLEKKLGIKPETVTPAQLAQLMRDGIETGGFQDAVDVAQYAVLAYEYLV